MNPEISEWLYKKGQSRLDHRRRRTRKQYWSDIEKSPPEFPGLDNNVANNSKSAKQPNGRKKTNFRFPPLASEFQDPRDSNVRVSDHYNACGGEVASGKSAAVDDNLLENQGFPHGHKMGNFIDSEQDDSKGFQDDNSENSVTTGPDFLSVFSGKPEKDMLKVDSSLDEFSSASADNVNKQATSINTHEHSDTDQNNKNSHREVTKTIEKSKETQAKITNPTAAYLNASGGKSEHNFGGSQSVKGTELSRDTGTGARPKTHVAQVPVAGRAAYSFQVDPPK
ncbi:hypothetical protein MAR_037511 [Mya arenaria]|uniref:Uncharacterized protein n=1 Tax=Mya arenaria TaxID=6604 RepID=A0ABY7FNY5_MYAAR|nr:hypothetical protein MAR_037511 [Mya arenaria]